MKYVLLLLGLTLCVVITGCPRPESESTSTTEVQIRPYSEGKSHPFIWDNATIYFLLLDRFNNGDSTNDLQFDRKPDGARLRYFMGGDFKGVSQKIREGYFDQLGVNAIWFTPPVEQIKSYTDEGTGKTYAYHGYWARDWTSLDPNFGTETEFAEMVNVAHEHGIRLVWDAVLNHTGPVTPIDTQWPEEWVRTDPTCSYEGYESTVTCTLVDNLPDIKTKKETSVELPQFLLDKWETEGRREKELAELDAFFERTGYPRAPKYYLIKWLTDWIRTYGIDAFRVDTAKHTEAEVWEELKKEAEQALAEWKQAHPAMKPDDLSFFMTGEVYGYSINNGKEYDYGDVTIDFFDYGFESLINFSFKYDAQNSYEELFSSYASSLTTGPLENHTVVNYLSSHDDGDPFDRKRRRVFETGTKLLLAPGIAQIYYGDETARDLDVAGTEGDAHLRSFMNWEELENNENQNGYRIQEVLNHWQKLGRFRREHLSVGAGSHNMLSESPYIFHRSYADETYSDDVVVVMDLDENDTSYELTVEGIFENGTELMDYYSGEIATVEDGIALFENPGEILLIGQQKK